MPLIPASQRRASGPSLRSTGSLNRSQLRSEPRAPTSTESVHSWGLYEEEPGFDGVEDRTLIDADLLAKLRSTQAPVVEPGSSQSLVRRQPRPSPGPPPSLPETAPSTPIEKVAKIADHAPPVPRAGDEVVATSPERADKRRPLNPRRRSANLPRPRLTRSGGGRVEHGPTAQRSVSADLKTLDFFIERGFTESAIALLAELERRYPNNDELRQRRQRIASMPR